MPVVLNGLLVSQRLPTIDMKNPVDSLTKVTLNTITLPHLTLLPVFFHSSLHFQIANKAIKLFTTWKLDLTPYVKDVKETLGQIYEKQVLPNFMFCMRFSFTSFWRRHNKYTFQAKGNKFEKLSGKEKRTLLARILEEEFVNPIQVISSKVRSSNTTCCSCSFEP